MKRLATLILATGLLATATITMMACETSDSPTVPDIETETPTGAWALQSFEPSGGDVLRIDDPSRYTLDLGVNEMGRANVRADCNVCGGDYEISGSSISFGLMACTLVACQPGSLERDYLEALGSTSLFQREGSSLTLGFDGGVLHFSAR